MGALGAELLGEVRVLQRKNSNVEVVDGRGLRLLGLSWEYTRLVRRVARCPVELLGIVVFV